MTTEDIGIFRLVDPPPGQADLVRLAIENIDYPWERIRADIDQDYDKAVLVEWGDTGQGVSGLFYGGSYRIVLSNKEMHLGGRSIFVFAHEVGHLVDRAGLDEDTRESLSELMHEPPFIQMGHFNHDHADAGHRSELWVGDNSYVSRINECYADQFVAAFAPTIWDGTVHPDASPRYPRFVHWTDDHQRVRELTLLDPEPIPVPEPKEEPVRLRDVPDDHPYAKQIRRAIRLNLMKPNRFGRFRPNAKLTRGQLAARLVQQYDRMK